MNTSYIELCSFEKLKFEQTTHRLLFLVDDAVIPRMSGFNWNPTDALFIPCGQKISYELFIECEVIAICLNDLSLFKRLDQDLAGKTPGVLLIKEPLKRYADHILQYLRSGINHPDFNELKINELYLILETYYSSVELADMFSGHSLDTVLSEC